MRVTVRLFAMIREEAGQDLVELDVAPGALAGDVVDRAYDAVSLSPQARGIPVVLAVNRRQVQRDAIVADGDELAVLPPVSGGQSARVWAAITLEPLSGDRLERLVADDRAGAIVTFRGVTRDVESLEYEAYEAMVLPRLQVLLGQVAANHGLCAIAAEHRIGTVPLGESSIIIAASAPHRPEAFAAAREAIDRVKVELPIWKREDDATGSRWVDGESLRAQT